MLRYKFNDKPLPKPEAVRRLAAFTKCAKDFVDVLQRDSALSSLERLCLDAHLQVLEISYNSWKRRYMKTNPAK